MRPISNQGLNILKSIRNHGSPLSQVTLANVCSVIENEIKSNYATTRKWHGRAELSVMALAMTYGCIVPLLVVFVVYLYSLNESMGCRTQQLKSGRSGAKLESTLPYSGPGRNQALLLSTHPYSIVISPSPRPWKTLG